jgi:hypothetical protein
MQRGGHTAVHLFLSAHLFYALLITFLHHANDRLLLLFANRAPI